MRAREVVGKRIARVEYVRFYNKPSGRAETVVARIILDDGSRLVPFAFETVDSPAATILYSKGDRRK